MATASIVSYRNGSTPVIGQSRDDLALGDVITVESETSGFSSYRWDLLFRPEGSVATLSPGGGITGPGPLTFYLDVEGPYLIRLQVTDGTGATFQYVRLRALTAFGDLALVAAGEKYGAVSIPSDATSVGWAYEQNLNLLKLLRMFRTATSPLQVAGENLVAGDAVALYKDEVSLELRAWKAYSNAENLELREVYGIAQEPALAGEDVPVGIALGASFQGLFETVLVPGDVGKIIFLSKTPGLLTIIPPEPPSNDTFRVGILKNIDPSNLSFTFQPQFVARFP